METISDVCADFQKTLYTGIFIDPVRAKLRGRLEQSRVQRQVDELADAASEVLAKFFESKEISPKIVKEILVDFGRVLAKRHREHFRNPSAIPDAVMNESLVGHKLPRAIVQAGEEATYRIALSSVMRALILTGPLIAEWEQSQFPRVFEPLTGLTAKLYEWSEPLRGATTTFGSSKDQRFEIRYRTELLKRAYGVDIGAIRIGTSQAVDIRELFVEPKLAVRLRELQPPKLARRARQASFDAPPLTLFAARELLERAGDKDAEEPKPRKLNAIEVFLREPKVVLIGLPGGGKSTLMEWLQVRLAGADIKCDGASQQSAPVPLLLRIRQFLDGDPPSPDEFVSRSMHSGDWSADMPEGWIHRLLTGGNVYLMLDGLDETDPSCRDEKLLPWLVDLIKRYPKNRYVVTSRPVGYPPGWLADLGFVECDLAGFDAEQAAEFTRHWNIARLMAERMPKEEAEREGRAAGDRMHASFREHPHIRHLARTPLMLAAVCLVNHYEGGRLPDDRPLLYKLCVEGMLHNWDQRRGIESGFSLEEKLRVCREVALKMQCDATAELTAKTVQGIFRAELGDETRAKQLLDHIRQRAGVLVERRPEVYAFAHLTFQEYLAAVAIHQGGSCAPTPEELANQFRDPRWREVIPLFCGVATRAASKRFLELLIDQSDSQELPYLLCEAYATAARELGRDTVLHDAVAVRVLDSESPDEDDYRTAVFRQKRFASLANQCVGHSPFGRSRDLSVAYRWLFRHANAVDWKLLGQRLKRLKRWSPAETGEVVHLVYAQCSPSESEVWAKIVSTLPHPGPTFSDRECYVRQSVVAWIAVSGGRRRRHDLQIDLLQPIVDALPASEECTPFATNAVLLHSDDFARGAARSAVSNDAPLLGKIRSIVLAYLIPKAGTIGVPDGFARRSANKAIKFLDEEIANLVGSQTAAAKQTISPTRSAAAPRTKKRSGKSVPKRTPKKKR